MPDAADQATDLLELGLVPGSGPAVHSHWGRGAGYPTWGQREGAGDRSAAAGLVGPWRARAGGCSYLPRGLIFKTDKYL